MGPEIDIGAHVYMYRKPKSQKHWEWFGPGVVIGKEGGNYWTSFGGRCHLVAPEHMRLATGEEIGMAFSAKVAQEDLHKLLELDFIAEDTYVQADETIEDGEGDVELITGEADDPEDIDDALFRESRLREGPQEPLPVAKRFRRKAPQDTQDPDAAAEGLREGSQEVFMMKVPKTERGRQKALEKELPWSLIPKEQHEGFKQAEQKQWLEHVEHDALEPLTVEDSRRILREKGSRVLNSRFAYRDKLWSRRRQEPSVGWKLKARLVISGHKEPDLLQGLPTHAPTISRQGILLLLQILASNLEAGWTGHAGDVSAAFLCGEKLERELFLRQPRSGLGDLHPEQLLRIKKPIFGLVDSPSAWWRKFSGVLKDLKLLGKDGEVWRVRQCCLDNCIFMVQKEVYDEKTGKTSYEAPVGYLGVHVDDVLLIGQDDVCALMREKLSQLFPIREWESDNFEYVGSYIQVTPEGVRLSQASYAATRLFEIEIEKGQNDLDEATEEQCHDNMSLIGALSWLACQSRPDLQVGVSLCQQRQKQPLVEDLKFTNTLARRALELQEQGLMFYRVDLNRAVLLCYHDAAWGNVPQSQEDPYYSLSPTEDQQGLFDNAVLARGAKAKKANSSIASQLGALYVLSDVGILKGERCPASILDWKSSACERVCRSTFAAETMACATSIETGDYISKFLETLLQGDLVRHETRLELRFLSDCRSLYDHLTKEGIPRVPSCKRLALDLASIRNDLGALGRIQWIPNDAQFADHLTKPLKANVWWESLRRGIKLTFSEGRGEYGEAV